MTVPGQYDEAMEQAGRKAALPEAPARLSVGVSLGIIIALSALLWRMIYLAVTALMN